MIINLASVMTTKAESAGKSPVKGSKGPIKGSKGPIKGSEGKGSGFSKLVAKKAAPHNKKGEKAASKAAVPTLLAMSPHNVVLKDAAKDVGKKSASAVKGASNPGAPVKGSPKTAKTSAKLVPLTKGASKTLPTKPFHLPTTATGGEAVPSRTVYKSHINVTKPTLPKAVSKSTPGDPPTKATGSSHGTTANKVGATSPPAKKAAAPLAGPPITGKALATQKGKTTNPVKSVTEKTVASKASAPIIMTRDNAVPSQAPDKGRTPAPTDGGPHAATPKVDTPPGWKITPNQVTVDGSVRRSQWTIHPPTPLASPMKMELTQSGSHLKADLTVTQNALGLVNASPTALMHQAIHLPDGVSQLQFSLNTEGGFGQNPQQSERGPWAGNGMGGFSTPAYQTTDNGTESLDGVDYHA